MARIAKQTSLSLLVVVLALQALVGCKEPYPAVPGQTNIPVALVEIIPAEGGDELALDAGPLYDRLGLRPETLLTTGRPYNPYREAEDKRRIQAYWQQRGWFDVEVANAETTFDPAEAGAAKIRWRVRENARYKAGEIVVKLPEGRDRDLLLDLVPIKTGSPEIDLEALRKARIDMQELLRRQGYGHANVYCRFFVDREKKLVHVYYFPDLGPLTVIGSVIVDGNVKIPTADILARAGLVVGSPYTEDLRQRVVRDLLDTGAFASAFVRVDTDTKFIAPGTAPDTGGELREDQIDADGNLLPRKLPPDVNIVIHVVESPRVNMKLRAGFEVDPARADTFLDTTLWVRNAFGPFDHLVVEGRIGYGILFKEASLEHPGLYGEGLIRTVHAGALGRTVDLRTTARYRGDLLPSAFLHRATTGPGLRTTFFKNFFFDVDLLAFIEMAERYGPFTSDERLALGLLDTDNEGKALAAGVELESRLVYDGRDDPVEPMSGTFAALRSRINPFALSSSPFDHPYFNVAGDFRGFVRLSSAFSLAFRASGEWSLLDEGGGIPLGARLFGGGAYGFRGLGSQRLSPSVTRCFEDFCKDIPVGGRSLVESSVELRFLPTLKQFGFIVFADLGGASFDANPFADGPSLAAGIGARLRIWYLPIAVDFAWRILEHAEVQDVDDVPFHAFFRIGESF